MSERSSHVPVVTELGDSLTVPGLLGDAVRVVPDAPYLDFAG